MRHAVLFLCYNRTPEQLDLSKQALDSVFAQDIGPLDIFAVNNGSTEPTMQWLNSLLPGKFEHYIQVAHYAENRSPLLLANEMSRKIYEYHDYVLGVPNDVILPANAYRLMNEWPRGFVSATPVEDGSHPEPVETARAVSECTPMCVMLTRKWAHDAIVAKDGYFFDEKMFLYASDCDLALRMAACGIHGIQLDVKFWHYRSAHWRLLPPLEGRKETNRADADRAYFRKRWGFACDSPQYGASAGDINFRGEVVSLPEVPPEQVDLMHPGPFCMCGRLMKHQTWTEPAIEGGKRIVYGVSCSTDGCQGNFPQTWARIINGQT